jgi:hypothetical protein
MVHSIRCPRYEAPAPELADARAHIERDVQAALIAREHVLDMIVHGVFAVRQRILPSDWGLPVLWLRTRDERL